MKEPYCNKECPNDCSSNYWKSYDAKKQEWNVENTVTVQCGKFDKLVEMDEYFSEFRYRNRSHTIL